MQSGASASVTPTIVLDTTELKETPRLDAGLVGLVLTASRLGRVNVAIPKVVVDELKRHQKRRITEALKKIEEGTRSLAAVSGQSSSSASHTVDDVYGAWERDIEARLASAKVEVLPVPAVSHEALLARDLAERKPFDADGRGYRDSLIWETVLSCTLESGDGAIVFVTRNESDFAEKKALHPHLQEDLRERNVPENRLRLACGLKAALETHLQGLLPQPDKELAATLARDAFGNIDLRRWLCDSLPSALAGLPGATSTTPSGEISVQNVADVEHLHVTSAWRLDERTIHVALDARLRVDMVPSAIPYVADVLQYRNNDFLGKALSNYVSYQSAVNALKNRQIDLCVEATFDSWGNGSNVDVRNLRIIEGAELPPRGPRSLQES